jgi:CheY-like chemotaxis protein
VLGKLKLGQGKRLAAEIPALAKMMGETDTVFSDALKYTRTLVAELSPPVLRDHGLAAGLKWLAEYMMKRDVSVSVMVPETEELRLPEDQAILLFQSVRELLINSSKHAGSGQAAVTMVQRSGSLSITVRDEGAGFDLAAVGDSSGTISSKFGLFSIRERMRALGGSFEIFSSPGQGTTATLVLPLIGAAAEAAGSSEWRARSPQEIPTTVSTATNQASRATHHASGTRVLLVDDHAMVRQGLRSVLDAYADLHVVGEAQDGSEAVTLVEELRPHVVVMDINMPKMSGIEATARIKAYWPDILVIGISVNTDDDNRAAMKRAGAAVLLTKEAAVDELYAVIRSETARAVHLAISRTL